MGVSVWAINDPGDDSVEYDAAKMRQLLNVVAAKAGNNIGARTGVVSGLSVSLAGSTITTTAGSAVIQGTNDTAQGAYHVVLDADETDTLAAADLTNPRKDIIVLRVFDNDQDSSGQRGGDVVYLQGTAAGTPTAPSVPDNAVLLGTIDVPKSGTGSATVSANGPRTAAAGGVIPCTSSTRPSGCPIGQPIYETDTKKCQVYDGSGWVCLFRGKQQETKIFTVGTGANENRTVNHGLDFTPTAIVVSGVTAVSTLCADTPTATNFRVRAFTSAGDPYTSGFTFCATFSE